MEREKSLCIPLPLYCGIMLINAMLLTAAGSFLPRLQAELGLSLSQQGLLVSGQFLGYTIAVLSGAVLADRFGKSIILRLAMLGFVLTAMLYWMARSQAALLAAVIMTGGFCGILENILTAVAYLDTKDAVHKSELLQFAYCIGAAGVPLVLYGFGAVGLGWRFMFPLLSGVMVLLFLAQLRQPIFREQEAMTFSAIGQAFASLLRSPWRLIAPLAMLAYVSAEVGIWGFLPTYISGVNGSAALVSVATALLWLSMAASRLIASRLKRSTRGMLYACVGGLIAGILIVLLAGGVWLLPAAALVGFVMGPIYAYLIDWMCQTTGSGSSSMIAVSMAFGTLGPVLTSPMTGTLGERFGLKSVMAVPLVASVGILLLLWLEAAKRQRTPLEEEQ